MRNFENKEKIIQVSGGLKIVSFLIMIVSGYAVLCGPLLLIVHKGPIISWSTFWHAWIFDGLEFMVWWNFWKFFGRLKEGHLFDALTVRRLTIAARWKIAEWVFSFITTLLIPPNSVSVGAALPNGLFGVIAIIFTAWLLREGQTMEEEQKLTV